MNDIQNYVKTMRGKIGHDPLILCGAGIILYKDDMILLQKRRDNQMYGIPGGCVELFEEVEDAARRELTEETGLTANKIRFLSITSGKDFTYPNGDRASIISIDYICNDFSGEIKNNTEETIECEWFNINCLPDNISPPDKNTICNFAKFLINKANSKEIIYKLEQRIANRTIANIEKYLSDDFIEYGSSGNVYTKEDEIQAFKESTPNSMKILDFEIIFLSDESVQSRYKSVYNKQKCQRSSIWRLTDTGWQMVFHQGTKL